MAESTVAELATAVGAVAGNAIGDAGSDGPFDASADSPPPHTKCDPSSPFTSVAPVAGGINTPRNEISVDLSSDELTMYVSVGDGDANFQIARATRTSVSSPWSAATPLGTSINAAGVQTADPTLSADGLTMYFSSFVAATPAHTFDIYAAVRATPVQEFASPQLIGVLQSDFNESRPRLRRF